MSVLMSYHRHIDRSRVQFDYLATRETDQTFEEEILALGGRVYHFPRPVMNAAYQKRMDAFFADHAGIYPVVHCHPLYASTIFGKAAKKHGVQCVIQHSHTSKYSANPLSAARNFTMLALFGRRATDFMACSAAAKKIFFWKRPEQVYLMRNALDLEKFSFSPEKREKLRAEFGIAEDALVLGHVGRFAKEKNHAFVLSLFRQLLRQHPNSHLLLVGDGELFDQVKALSAQMDLTDHITFAGRQSDVGGCMSAMDVFVMPSLFEGLGIVLIEAQANGLPCIASNQVPPEAKASDLLKYLPLGSKEEWAACALALAEDRCYDQEKKLTEAGYNITVEAQRLMKYYLSLT